MRKSSLNSMSNERCDVATMTSLCKLEKIGAVLTDD